MKNTSQIVKESQALSLNSAKKANSFEVLVGGRGGGGGQEKE
jgi:hypothetical protein